MLCLLTGQAPQPSDEAEEAEAQTVVPVLTAALPPPDLEAALLAVKATLHEAEQLIAEMDLAIWPGWIARFTEQTAQAASAWEAARQSLDQQRAELAGRAVQAFAPDDWAELSPRLELVIQQCQKPPDLAPAQHAFAQLAEEVKAYATRRQTALAEYKATLTAHGEALNQAHLWQLSPETDLPNLPADYTSISVRDLERNAKLLRETHHTITEAIQQARVQLTNNLVLACEELLAQPDSAIVAEALAVVQTRLHAELSDDDLRAIEVELSSLSEQVRAAQSNTLPDVVEAAQAYQRDPDQTYLDILLEALAQHGRVAEVYALLTIALQSNWRPDTSLSSAVFQSYWRGLLDVTPPAWALTTAIETLSGSLFVTQTKLEDPGTRLGLAIFYVSALAAHPYCLEVSDLWRLRLEENPTAGSLWSKLINRVRQGALPKIRRPQDLPAHELQRLTAKIEDDLKREDGRFARVRGKGSLTMLNMEQQHLLPALEERWKTLKHNQPGKKAWGDLKHWLTTTDEAQVFEFYCEQGGVTTDDSPFFRPTFKARIRHLLDNFTEYIALKEETAGLQAEHYVMLAEALDELSKLAPYIGAPLVTLTQMALSEIGETASERSEAESPVLTHERPFVPG